ncbi:hypothetical protein VOWphi5012_099 [Vibrio phage phi50-12]|uniref:Uncharacterized protein n=1 Tax=Vibrio phage phi50-12 TaxID=2654972 RepID=A0A5P8PRI2_9CAUD|nr:hypothetical protein KNU82_gp099 [Vibrio phage phi50-12]QFR59883.1 hypothetical protein VOWphi5012_099 [Vibrio phage phi50-12]
MTPERQRGYNEAKNHHQNGHTLDNWQKQIQVAKDFDDYTDFDKGIEDYIKEINKPAERKDTISPLIAAPYTKE